VPADFHRALFRHTDLFDHVADCRSSEVVKEEVRKASAVHAGQGRVSAEVAAEIAEHASDDALTPREADVLRLVAGGNANKEIAGQLFLTEETVKSHIRNILAKLAANDRTHAVAIGLKRGIIEL
jgi:DNA-binding NarL/FixJ family response regulator